MDIRECGSVAIEDLEAAAFESWPALDGEEEYFGWRLRYGRGYTKRANSANSGAGAAPLSDEQLDEIERRYRHRRLQPVFRLVSATVPAGTDVTLERRGYRDVGRSLVMHSPLVTRGELPTLVADAGDWLAEFAEMAGRPPADHDVHLQMLRAIKSPCAFAVERRDGKAASVALGVLVNGKLGLFDVFTAPEYRRQGLAAGLCAGLLAWGHERSAHVAYLQVDASNAAAVELYRRLGFQQAYHYWYRVAQ